MKVVLHDGTEIDNAMVGKMRDMIEITMTESDVTANLSKFIDPEIMSEITFYSGAWKTVYSGFNRLSYINNSRNDNEMQVWMEGSENATVSEIPRYDEMYMPKGAPDQNG